MGARPEPPGERENGAGVEFSQIGHAERTLDRHRIADLKFITDIGAGDAARNVTNVELEKWLIGAVGHRIVATWLPVECYLGVLTRGEHIWPA